MTHVCKDMKENNQLFFCIHALITSIHRIWITFLYTNIYIYNQGGYLIYSCIIMYIIVRKYWQTLSIDFRFERTSMIILTKCVAIGMKIILWVLYCSLKDWATLRTRIQAGEGPPTQNLKKISVSKMIIRQNPVF